MFGADKMRTYGGRGAEGWMVAIPIIALLVVSTMSSNGIDAMLSLLDGTVRSFVASIVELVGGLF